jgi:hypothetical protein
MKFDSDILRRAGGTLAENTAGPTSVAVVRFVLALLIVGVVARLSPLLDPAERLFWQFMTEDGYLMQTVARNMAIGLGMTTAEGTIATNGVQPLATFLFAALHVLAGGSRSIGIVLVTVVSMLVAVAGAYYLFRLGDRLFSRTRKGRELAMLAAGLWFVAPHVMAHSMNGLETGLYHLAVLMTLHFYLSMTADAQQSLVFRKRVFLGVLLGVTFLARNDAVFFIAALLIAHLLIGGKRSQGGYVPRFWDCMVAGITSILIASPWLINNYQLFGSIVPISGSAQSHATAFATNLAMVPAILFESAVLFVPIPGSLETQAAVIAFSLVALALVLYFYWLSVARASESNRRVFAVTILFSMGLATYYGLFFGAAWFLSRYFSVLSPLLWLGTVSTAWFFVVTLWNRPDRERFVAISIVMLLGAMGTVFAAMQYRNGSSHMHRQVVEWVESNVPSETWVGAPQTGTLGFFHDRTINLDGKVNPEALRVLMSEGHILDYVVDSKIEYIADWVGMADWVHMDMSPEFSRQFEIVVRDEALNLGVLRRIQPVTVRPDLEDEG